VPYILWLGFKHIAIPIVIDIVSLTWNKNKGKQKCILHVNESPFVQKTGPTIFVKFARMQFIGSLRSQ